MSSKASVERIQAERISRPWPQRGCGRHGSSGHLFGLDAERMSPKAQTFAALAVLAPVALSGVFLVAFLPGLRELLEHCVCFRYGERRLHRCSCRCDLTFSPQCFE